MDIHCPHFSFCSGCSVDSEVDKFALLTSAQNYFSSIGHPGFKLHALSPIRWRCRAKLAVRGTVTSPLIGLFEKASHRVHNIPQCKVHHPWINHAVNLLREWVVQQEILPYDEVLGTGLLRYVQLTVERSTQKVQLVLVLNQKSSITDSQKVQLKALWETGNGLWHSIWLNVNTKRDNVIFGRHWELFQGENWLWESFRGIRMCFHPASFMQANPEMFDLLLSHVELAIPANSSLLELYAGSGAIGLALLKHCRQVQFVEIVPWAEACFKNTCQHLRPDEVQKLNFISAPVHKHLALLNQGADVLIVDPPRKGLDKALREALCHSHKLRRLIYISCGWESFQKDCDILLAAGWKLIQAQGFLFFPGSEHLETLAIFDW